MTRFDCFLGGAGTTVTALMCGVPQVLVPNTSGCSDQLYHGSKVVSLGCGILMPPPPAGAWKSGDVDVVGQVRNILQEYSSFKTKCKEWAEELRPAGTGEGLSTAIEGLRRMIAGIVIKKESGQWTGWTEGVIAEDRKRYGAAGVVQRCFDERKGRKRRERQDKLYLKEVEGS